jgi:glycosyltransferase involved in cell wall biosynthesis
MSRFKHLITSNVNVREDAVQALSESSLYVHPARGDVFPVAPLEAMYIGLPVICSNECGTKELLPEENIFNLNKNELANKILNKNKIKKKKLEIFEQEVLEKIKLF